MIEVFTLISIIALFSLIQSVFGVGLLLFGTPTLLLLGYSYSETLWIVLPSSLSISLAQICNHSQLVKGKRDVYLFTLPSALMSLTVLLYFEESWDITKIVGSFLLMIGLLRASKILKVFLYKIINKKPKYIYIFTGLIHGLSNMGGGPLSILMATIHNNNISIRTNIAYVYCGLCLLQLFVLAVIKSEGFNSYYLLFPIFSLLIYLFFNKLLMRKVNENNFQTAITCIIIFYGIASIF